jgi:hypothetical protein
MTTWNFTVLRFDLQSNHVSSMWHASPMPGVNIIRRLHNEVIEE